METGYRTFTIERAEGDGVPRGILTTEQAVQMFDWERGEFVPEVILMSGMKARGLTIKLLDTHNTDSVRNVLGSFVDLRVNEAGKRDVPHKFVDGEIRVSKTEPDVQTKLEEGHINEMSVGYRYSEDHTIRLNEGEKQTIDGKEYVGPLNIRTQWEAQEASLVPIGADNQAQIRGFKSLEEAQKMISQKRSEETNDDSVTTDEVQVDDKTEESETEPISETETKQQHKTIFINMENQIDEVAQEKAIESGIKAGQESFDKRADAIMAIGEEVGDAQWAISELRSGRSVEAVQSAAIKKLKESNANVGVKTEGDIGLSKKEQRSYSISKAMLELAEGRSVSGLEGEVSNAISSRCNRSADGFFVAPEALSGHAKRDDVLLSADGSATDGPELVGSDLRAGEFVDVLRPNMVTVQAGIRVINGATQDVVIPRKSSASEAAWVGDEATTAHARSAPQFANITLVPNHLGTSIDVSKQLLVQGLPDVDSLIRDDLNQAIAVGLDKSVLQGSGSNQPQGIDGASGVPTSTISSAAAPAKAEIFEFLEDVDTGNALTGSLAWVTTPAMASYLKQTQIDSSTGNYFWDVASDTVLGYAAHSTSNAAANDIFFGNWNDYIMCIFDGIDLVVDPYSNAKKRLLTYTVNIMADGDVRQPSSFCTNA
ncbi:MAG: phage major capsid protein [Aequorivita sp.]|nr:phage major capsid protein [Aequorivita sp.]